jgi:hypothetical protein
MPEIFHYFPDSVNKKILEQIAPMLSDLVNCGLYSKEWELRDSSIEILMSVGNYLKLGKFLNFFFQTALLTDRFFEEGAGDDIVVLQ